MFRQFRRIEAVFQPFFKRVPTASNHYTANRIKSQSSRITDSRKFSQGIHRMQGSYKLYEFLFAKHGAFIKNEQYICLIATNPPINKFLFCMPCLGEAGLNLANVSHLSCNVLRINLRINNFFMTIYIHRFTKSKMLFIREMCQHPLPPLLLHTCVYGLRIRRQLN